MVSSVIAAIPSGPYVSAWKVIPLLLVLLLWGRLVTWIDKDAPEVLLPRLPINLGNLLGGIIGLLLFFMLPGFLVALLVLFAIVLAEIGVYLAIRAQKVGVSDLSGKFSNWVRSFGRGEKEVKVIAGEVQFIGKNGNLLPEPAGEDPVRPAYDAVQSLFTEPLRKGAEEITLVPADGTAAINYTVDGVRYPGNAMEKARAASAVSYLKEMSGMDTNERRKPQLASMKVSVDGRRFDMQIITAGSTAGEQLRASIDVKKRHLMRLEELGMSEDQVLMMKELIAENTGVVLLSAPKGHGLTALEYAVMRAHDAFLTHIHTVESDLPADLEGITQNKFVPGTGEPSKTVDWVISQEPDVIMMARVEDSKSAIALNKYGGNEKRVYVGLRASNTFDALSAWRQLIGDDSAAVRNLRMVVNARVMRKLCPACKAGYTPDPTTLRKLNMDPDKVPKLYQARTQPMRDPKGNPIMCEFCKELHFKGRTGVYEILLIDDDVRAVIEAGGSINQLKSAFRKQSGRYLQEMALEQVAAGETSIQEMLRVMKSDDRPSAGGQSGARLKPSPNTSPSARPQAAG